MIEFKVRPYQVDFIITCNFRYSLDSRQSAFSSEHEPLNFYFFIFPPYYIKNMDSPPPVLIIDSRGQH